MPGKGKRRREKNFRAAHGGESRLPPPPDPRAVDAVPSKLRRLMQLMKGAPPTEGTSRGSKDNRGRQDKRISRDKIEEKKGDPEKIGDGVSNDKKRKKRANKGVRDLRFQDLEEPGMQRKQRRKEYFKARKTKSKREKKSESSEFPEREEVKFGDVVVAPPKLSFPKGSKTALDASSERRRLQAVEAYRNLKGWESRPGIHLPPISEGLS